MKICNRTPHDLHIIPTGTASDVATVTIPAAPRGEIARVETSDVVLRRGVRRQVDGDDQVESVEAPLVVIGVDATILTIPVVATHWGRIIGLPAPSAGVVHVVSVIVAAAAHAAGRGIDDLYVPGGQVRDATGRIVGCASLCRASDALPGGMLMGSPLAEIHSSWTRIADMLAMRDFAGAADVVQPEDTRRPVGSPDCEIAYLCRCHDAPRGYGGWWLVGWMHGFSGWTLRPITDPVNAASWLTMTPLQSS